MAAPISSQDLPPKDWLRRLDRIAGNLNAVLFVFAIGLAVLDGTVLMANLAVAQLAASAAASSVLATPATAPDTQPAMDQLVSGSE